MFFESPDVAPMTYVQESSFPPVVKVTNGVLTEAQIVRQLRELVPDNYQWDLVKLENQTYKVDFPTRRTSYISLSLACAEYKVRILSLLLMSGRRRSPRVHF